MVLGSRTSHAALVSSGSASTPGGGEPGARQRFHGKTALQACCDAQRTRAAARTDDCDGLACCKRRVCGEGRSRGAASQGLPAVQCQAVSSASPQQCKQCKTHCACDLCGLIRTNSLRCTTLAVRARLQRSRLLLALSTESTAEQSPELEPGFLLNVKPPQQPIGAGLAATAVRNPPFTDQRLTERLRSRTLASHQSTCSKRCRTARTRTNC